VWFLYGIVQYQLDTYHIDVLQQVVTEVLEEAGYTRDYAFSLEDFIQVQKSFSVSISVFPPSEHMQENCVLLLRFHIHLQALWPSYMSVARLRMCSCGCCFRSSTILALRWRWKCQSTSEMWKTSFRFCLQNMVSVM
jgi:hypothetical protein